MTPDDPRHGKPAGVWAHQRAGQRVEDCLPCLHARRRYLNHRAILSALGHAGYATLGEENLAKLLGARKMGVTLEAIALAVGSSASQVSRWCKGDATTRVWHQTRARLDAWQPSQPVTGIGVLRRLQGLMWLGYTSAGIARDTRLDPCTVAEGLRYQRTEWHTRSARAIVAYFDAHCMVPAIGSSREERGAITRARNEARRRGYSPPLAWDNIDDPNEEPRGMRGDLADEPDAEDWLDRILCGERPPARAIPRPMRAEIVAMWTSTGLSVNELERRTGWKPQRYKGAA